MITYQQERLADIQTEVAALVHPQVSEMAVGFENFVEKPNWTLWLGLEAKDMLILLTARDSLASRRLVGYLGAYIYPSTTSQHTMVQATPYYVVPCRFRAIILKRLFQTLREHPRAQGALITIKTHTWASAGPILEHLGFRPVETWYMLDTLSRPAETPDARTPVECAAQSGR